MDTSALDALTQLQRFLHTFLQDAPPQTPRLASLEAAVAKLSRTMPIRAVKCPPNYIELWNSVRAGVAAELPNRAVRFLSWETSIAISPGFQNIALRPDRCSARSLQGMVRCAHRRWNSTAGTPCIGNLNAALTKYVGRNAVLLKWRSKLTYVLHTDGPRSFARDILATSASWEQVAEEWGLEPDSEFGNKILENCVATATGASGNDADKLRDNTISRILRSRSWAIASFKQALQDVVLASHRFSTNQCDALKDFILSDSRLLDPRLPANMPNWIGISDSARDLVIQWLSAEDIQLFFDHVLPNRSDPHGRKPFWLKYKNRIKKSRPLLAYGDETRWRASAATQGKYNFGRMEYNCDTSAFLLDFGPVMVVEFSKVGNAVYLYRHRDVPGLSGGFWSNARFPLKDLKQLDACADRLTHNLHWQHKMRTLLAQFGIYPGA